jgi:hypothetical protein
MAELTKMETKLAEVIGLAMAAQDATTKVGKLVKDRELAGQLRTMTTEAAAAEKDGTELAAGLRGKKGAVMTEARSVKKKAAKMMSDYLEKSSDGLDGFEFLTMAEAGEVGHWSVLGEMAKSAGNRDVRALVGKHLPIQKRHLRDATAGSLKLARGVDPNVTDGSGSSAGRRRASSRARSSGGSSAQARGRSSASSSSGRRTGTARGGSKSRSTSTRRRSSS